MQRRLPITHSGRQADIGDSQHNVRFTPNSGHSEAALKCPLSPSSGHPQTERPPYGGLPKSISSDEEWSSPYLLPGLRQYRLIWFQVGPRSRKNLGDAFDAGNQRTLQKLNTLRELLRIALGRLP